MPLVEIKLKPAGPWRAGHRSGDRERADSVYHSDALYSAVTHAMRSLGWLDAWLDATARAESGSAVRFSSLFPFVQENKHSDATRLLPPPRTAWPPSGAGKLYVNAAKLVPVDVARRGIVSESQWIRRRRERMSAPRRSRRPVFCFDAICRRRRPYERQHRAASHRVSRIRPARRLVGPDRFHE